MSTDAAAKQNHTDYRVVGTRGYPRLVPAEKLDGCGREAVGEAKVMIPSTGMHKIVNAVFPASPNVGEAITGRNSADRCREILFAPLISH